MPIVNKPPELVVHVRCRHCRHKSLLSNKDFGRFWHTTRSAHSNFCKAAALQEMRKRCVLANRIDMDQPAARRLRA
jgi:hypothetical protein